IGEVIAAGGMGTVYRGIDRLSGQPVAIKQLKPELLTEDPSLLERFAREGEVLAALNHPNIVRYLTRIEANQQNYLILEYVAGGSLADLLKTQPQLPLERVLSIALELADALSRAHHLKIIHRDIKPANVLLALDGTPRLTDFGVARIGISDITRTGQVV